MTKAQETAAIKRTIKAQAEEAGIKILSIGGNAKWIRVMAKELNSQAALMVAIPGSYVADDFDSRVVYVNR